MLETCRVALGCVLLEGYGQTESSAACSITMIGDAQGGQMLVHHYHAIILDLWIYYTVPEQHTVILYCIMLYTVSYCNEYCTYYEKRDTVYCTVHT